MDPSGEDMNSLYSPSFSSYFTTNLAQVVARVTTEFAPADDDDFSYNSVHNNTNTNESREYHNEVDDDFEFNLSNLVPAAGDIRPVYPVFDRDLLRDYDLVDEIDSRPSDHEEESATNQIQLKNLFLDDRDGNPPSSLSSSSSSSSSSEADELDRIPPGSYCVWMPNKSPCASPSPGRCTKSNSTGSSAAVAEKAKTWKLRDLLKRSRSDGKKQGGLMLLTPKKKVDTPAGRGGICSVTTAAATGKPMREAAALEGYLAGRRREAGDKNKRRSYLPYRQDLVGFFVSPRALCKMHIPLSR